MAVKDLVEQIVALENKIKELHPKQKGRVLIANAKQNVDYTFDKINEKNTYEWNARYYDELSNII